VVVGSELRPFAQDLLLAYFQCIARQCPGAAVLVRVYLYYRNMLAAVSPGWLPCCCLGNLHPHTFWHPDYFFPYCSHYCHFAQQQLFALTLSLTGSIY